MAEQFVVSWALVLDYFHEKRESTIRSLADAATDRELWKAQGRLALLEELLTLKDYFETLEEIDKEALKSGGRNQRR